RHLRLAGTAATAAEPAPACLLGSAAAAVRGRSCRPLPVPPAFPDDPVAGAEPVLRGTGRAWRGRPDAVRERTSGERAAEPDAACGEGTLAAGILVGGCGSFGR